MHPPSLSKTIPALTLACLLPALAGCGATGEPDPPSADSAAPNADAGHGPRQAAGADTGSGLEGGGGEIGLPPVEPTADFETDPGGRAVLRGVQAEIVRRYTVSDDNLRALRNLHERWPDQPDVLETLKSALARREDWEGLAALYEAQPSLTSFERADLGKVLIRIGRFEEAVEILVPLADEVAVDADLSYHAALALYRTGDRQRAAGYLDRMWDGYIQHRMVQAIALRGQIFFDEGNLARARRVFEQALEIDDSLAAREAYDGLGRTLVALGEEEAAKEVFDTLDAMNASAAEYEQRRLEQFTKIRAVQTAWEEGDMEETERLLDEVVPLAEDRFKPMLYTIAADVYRRTGRAEQADEAVKLAEEYEAMTRGSTP